MSKTITANGTDYRTSYGVFSVIQIINSKTKNMLFDTEEDASDYYESLVDRFKNRYPDSKVNAEKTLSDKYGQTNYHSLSLDYMTEYGNQHTAFFAYKRMNVYTREA